APSICATLRCAPPRSQPVAIASGMGAVDIVVGFMHCYCRHPGESRDPCCHIVAAARWIPAFAGMTMRAVAMQVIPVIDFRGEGFVGPPALLQRVELWPRRLIAMTLARVGSGEGPDLDRLLSLQAVARGRKIHAAGGVRHLSDLGRLAAMGVAGVLVASALHDGSLGPAELERARAGSFEGAS